MQVLDVIIGSVLSMGLTYTFVRCDRLRLSPAQRQRAWNTATTGAAIFTFSPLCIVAHFWVTRRSFTGLLAGVAALAVLIVVQVGLTLLYQEIGLLALAATVLLTPIILTAVPLILALALL
ncbi:MAG: hypothetical protein ACOC1F_01445 [Myxococcota bacterium]